MLFIYCDLCLRCLKIALYYSFKTHDFLLIHLKNPNDFNESKPKLFFCLCTMLKVAKYVDTKIDFWCQTHQTGRMAYEEI